MLDKAIYGSRGLEYSRLQVAPPLLFEPHYRARQERSVISQQLPEGYVEVPSRESVEVQFRDEFRDTRRSSAEEREYSALESDRLLEFYNRGIFIHGGILSAGFQLTVFFLLMKGYHRLNYFINLHTF